MANLSESISKSIPLRMNYRVKTSNHSYMSVDVDGKPFFDDDLLSQKDLLTAINAFMRQETSPHGGSCRGIVLVNNPASMPQEGESSPTITPRNINDEKSNLWARRKAKAEKDHQELPPPLSPPNLSVATTLEFADPCSSSASSVHSAVSVSNTAYPPLPHSASSVSSSMSNHLHSTASPVSSVYSYEGNNFGHVSPTIVQAPLFINLDNSSSTSLASASSSVAHSESASPTTSSFAQNFQPYEADNTQYNSNYWNFNDGVACDKPQADFTLLPNMFPPSVAPSSAPPAQLPQQPQAQQAQGPYAVPSTFYLDTSKLHSAGPGQPAVPEVYDINAMHRLQMMGQQPLPPSALAYPPAYHPHPAPPAAFGYKSNEMITPMMPAVTGGFYMGAPQAAVNMRPTMRGGKRKSRYGGMGVGLNGGFTGHICAECHVLESPEWRKGPKGPKTLCNACGLRWAKKSRKESQKNKAVTSGSN